MCFITLLVSLATTGATITTAGKAITKANAHAFNQMASRFSTKPTLNNVMTKDIKHDINSAIKKAKTKRWYLLGIIMGYFLQTPLKANIMAWLR